MALNKLIKNTKIPLLVSGMLLSTALFSQNLENRVKYNLNYGSSQTGNIKYKGDWDILAPKKLKN